MALDRDLGIALVRAAFAERTDLRGAELFAATGVRGLRLAAESGRFRRFVLLERAPMPLRTLDANARAVPGAAMLRGDAARPPLIRGLDYVDIDPYGTPAPFLDAGLALVADGGVLAVTATDMPVLTGVARGVAERRYGGRPVRGRYGPEAGLRLLLAHVGARARGVGRRFCPLAAYVQDHHVRAIGRITAVAGAPDPVGLVDPSVFAGPPLPPGGPYGPLWLGPLFDPEVIARAEPFESAARPRELVLWLGRFREEAEVDAPFYFEPNEVASSAGLRSPPSPGSLIAALREDGFRAARSHVREAAIRTDAPRSAVEAAARRLAG